jgi:hypothetical protein
MVDFLDAAELAISTNVPLILASAATIAGTMIVLPLIRKAYTEVLLILK